MGNSSKDIHKMLNRGRAALETKDHCSPKSRKQGGAEKRRQKGGKVRKRR